VTATYRALSIAQPPVRWRRRIASSLIDFYGWVLPVSVLVPFRPLGPVFAIAWFVVWPVVGVVWLQGCTGSSVGKLVAGLRVVDREQRTPPGTRRVLLRLLGSSANSGFLFVPLTFDLMRIRRGEVRWIDQLLGCDLVRRRAG
jgi:uncharacterized RDD family membrane protein YckC